MEISSEQEMEDNKVLSLCIVHSVLSGHSILLADKDMDRVEVLSAICFC
jgi:hypothetical protein